MPKRYTVEFTRAEIENIRWMANLGMANNDAITTQQLATVHSGLTKMVQSTGRKATIKGGSVFSDKK